MRSHLETLFQKKDIPLSAEQWALMGTLWSNAEGLSANQLGQKTLKEKSTVSRHISKLKKKGWVEERDNIEDGRSTLLQPSQKANSKSMLVFNCIKKTSELAEKGISKRELKTTLDVLMKIQKNFDCLNK